MQERIKKLESVGFSWNVKESQQRDLWNAKFDHIKQYKHSHGDCNVPDSYTTSGGVKLGRWVGKQRYRYKKELEKGKRTTMMQERIEKLESIGFSWNVQESQQSDMWNAKFELLQEYKHGHGDCNVPDNYTTSDGVKLGRWVGRQRRQYKKLQEGKPSILTQEQIEKLKSI